MSVGSFAGALAPVRDFDRYLGDPDGSAGVIDIARSVELDERSAFPADAVEAIDAWGLQSYYVPTEHGGSLTDSLVPMLMIRHLARRDLTAAVAHGKTFLGSVCAWVAGGDIARRMGSIVMTGDPVSWGLTEKGRGSDISRSATTVQITEHGIRVDGAKWPINNATRGRAMTVLARSEDTVGPRSLSLALVDKANLDPSTIEYEPKASTHGVRGADISGIRFAGTRIESEALVGQRGHGLEIVLKSLQMTRPLTTALSVGAADHALRIALDFADSRRLYGRLLADLPAARMALAEAVADTLLAECVMYAGARTLHHAPAELSLVSALVKFLVPETVDLLFRDLTGFLGARSQLVGIAGAGAFQKAARDNRVVGIFDGNSIVNLNVIINEFPRMLRVVDPPRPEDVLEPFRSGAGESLPVGRLRLVTRQGSRLLRALPQLVEYAEDGRTSAGVLRPARRIAAQYTAALAEAATLPRQVQPHPRAFHLAERLALAFGATCALASWLARREAIDSPFGEDDAWLAAVLQRVDMRLGGDSIDADVADAVTDAAFRARRAHGVVSTLSDWGA